MNQSSSPDGQSVNTLQSGSGFYERVSHHFAWLLPLLLIVIGGAVYAPAANGVFVLDDRAHIYESARFEHVLPLSQYLGRRGLMNFTFALNYAIDGQNPRGYHIVNIVIHLLASVVLYGMMRRLLLLPQWRKPLREHACVLAFLIAAIWMVHPLLTQAVSYVIQRGESLAGLFVLVAGYGLVRLHGSAVTAKQTWWAVVCVLAMVCAVWTKESMLTAAIGLFLLDLCLLSCDFKTMLKQRWWLHGLLAITMTLPLLAGVNEFKAVSVTPVSTATSDASGESGASTSPATVSVVVTPKQTVPVHVIPSLMTLDQYPSAGFGMPGMTWKQYFFTQPAVICFYLKLAFWPSEISLEHNWRPMTTPWAGWRLLDLQLAFALLVTLAVLSLWTLWRLPWLGLAGCWFFLSLGVTSSFIPINDMAVEHRMYLAMVAVVAAAVLVSWQLVCWLEQRTHHGAIKAVAMGAACVVVLALGARSFVRNMDYQSELALWESALREQEPSVRTRLNLGSALYEAGHKEAALKQFEMAQLLRPGNANTLMNIGSLYYNQRDLDHAETYYRQALRMAPTSAKAMVFLARVKQKRGQHAQALALLKQASAADARNASILNALAKQNFEMGQIDDAAAVYEQLLAMEGPTAATLTNLGMTRVAQKKYDEALLLFTRVTEMAPAFAPGWEQQARSFARAGRFKEAHAALLQATRVSSAQRLQQQLVTLLAHCPDPAVRNIPQAMFIVEQYLLLTKRQDIGWLELAAKVALAANRPDLALQAEIDALALARRNGASSEALAQGQAVIDKLRKQIHQMQQQGTSNP